MQNMGISNNLKNDRGSEINILISVEFTNDLIWKQHDIDFSFERTQYKETVQFILVSD